MDLPIDAATILNLSRGDSAPQPPAPPPGLPWQQLYAAALGQEAYVWAFPWLYLTQLCWLWTSDAGKEIAHQKDLVIPWAPMNSFFHAEKLGRHELDVGRDGVAVHLPARSQCPQHQQSQSALQNVVLLRAHTAPLASYA